MTTQLDPHTGQWIALRAPRTEDTLDEIALDLSRCHPMLASAFGWRRVLTAAASGDNAALAVLYGTSLADRAVAWVVNERSVATSGVHLDTVGTQESARTSAVDDARETVGGVIDSEEGR